MNAEQVGNAKQNITLQGSDDQNVYAVTSNDVTVVPSISSAKECRGSNKISVKPTAKFDWDARYCPGNQIAVHHLFPLCACTVQRQGTSEPAPPFVRVRNLETESQVLLRGFEGRILDISFSFTDSETLVGVLDERGTLRVFRIEEKKVNKSNSIESKLLLEIVRDRSEVARTSVEGSHIGDTYGRIFWTRYIPEEEDEENEEEPISPEDRLIEKERVTRLLLVTFNENCVFLDAGQLSKIYASKCDVAAANAAQSVPLEFSQLTRFAVTVEGQTKSISDAQISPDGSAFATASLDGGVRFYSVTLIDLDPISEQSCTAKQPMHTWWPHEHRPVTALRFLDNYRDTAQSVWRYALTACDYGRELKLWLCTEWTCMQTIRFADAPFDAPAQQRLPSMLKLAVDDAAQYVVATDVRRHVLYVLHLSVDDANGKADDSDDNVQPRVPNCQCTQLAEFILSVPCYAFGLINPPPGALTSNGASQQTKISLMSMHARQLQQMLVSYQRPPLPQKGSAGNTSTTKIDELTDMIDNLGLNRSSGNAVQSQPVQISGSDEDEREAVVVGNSPGDGIDTQLIGPDAFLSKTSIMETTGTSTLNDSAASDRASDAKPSAIDSSVAKLQKGGASPAGSHAHSKNDLHLIPTASFSRSVASPASASAEVSNSSTPAIFAPTILGLPVGNASAIASPQPLQSFPNPQAYAALQNDVRRLSDAVAQLAQAMQAHQERVESQLNRLSAQQTQTARIPNGSSSQGTPITAADLRAQLERQEAAMTSRFDRELRSVRNAIEQTANKMQHAPTQQQQQQQPALNDAQLSVLREAVRNATAECVGNAQRELRAVVEVMQKDTSAQINGISSKFDAAMHQELAKWVSNKANNSQISQAVATALRQEALAALTATFERVALPAFQQSADALFAQLNQTFQHGVNEWLAHVTAVGKESNTRLSEAFDRTTQDALERLERNAARSITDATRTALGTNDAAGNSLAESIAQGVVARLKPELATQLNDSLAGALGRSRAQTPSVATTEKRCDPARLAQLIADRQYNEAFQEALSANSLRYVLLVCEQVRASDLFAIQPCPLQLPVLLSLIQQLSVTMELSTSKQLIMRLEYIQSALTCLDVSNPVVREHCPRIAQGIQKAIDVCLQKGSFAADCTMKLRTLRMLAQSFLSK